MVRAPWTVEDDEVQPELKQVAGRYVEALGTYDRGGAGRGLSAAEREVAAPLLLEGAWSRARTRFVQLGGLRPVTSATYASAMVVAEQTLTDGAGTVRRVVRTLDVRVRRSGGAWAVDELVSCGGTAVTTAGASSTGTAVLRESRLVLPDSARWDVAARAVDDRLLAILLELCRPTPLTVTVLRSGHPPNVIDDRRRAPVSAHTRGRAVDVWAVDGVPVRRLSDAQVRDLGQRALALGALQVGVPRGLDLDGGGRRSFANEVHDDHIHIAV